MYNNNNNSNNNNNLLGNNNREMTMDSSSYIESLIRDTVGNDPIITIKNVITDSAKEKLIKKIYKSSELKETDGRWCAIMQQDFKDGDEITCLPCNHSFLTVAIERWLNEESCYCPVCKYKLDSYEKKIEKEEENNNFFELLRRTYNPLINTNVNRFLDNIINEIDSTSNPETETETEAEAETDTTTSQEITTPLLENNVERTNTYFSNNLMLDIYREILNTNSQVDLQNALFESYREN